jgi:hypothetical protein
MILQLFARSAQNQLINGADRSSICPTVSSVAYLTDFTVFFIGTEHLCLPSESGFSLFRSNLNHTLVSDTENLLALSKRFFTQKT